MVKAECRNWTSDILGCRNSVLQNSRVGTVENRQYLFHHLRKVLLSITYHHRIVNIALPCIFKDSCCYLSLSLCIFPTFYGGFPSLDLLNETVHQPHQGPSSVGQVIRITA